MKKIFLLLVLCLIGTAIFVNYTFRKVFHHTGPKDLSIRVSEDEDRYELDADYPERKTHLVQSYMDEVLGTNNTFANSRVDADITIDNIRLHVKTKPGFLSLAMNKSENDSAAYAHVKELEKGLQEKLDDGSNK